MPKPAAIRITTIIPAYHAWATLPSVLDALAPQIGPGREALLVDSGIELPSAHVTDRWPWLRVLTSIERLPPSQARNLGASHASGELLAFLDADATPSYEWLDRLEAALTPQSDAVVGTILNGTPGSRIGTAEYLLTCSETLPGRVRPPRHAPSANLLVRREAFAAAGGFDERLRAGEDTVLTFPIAQRGRLAFAALATVEHRNRVRLAPFLANQRRQGAGFVAICTLTAYPNRWVSRGPALLLAGPLRLLALARVVLRNPSQAGQALRSLPQLVLGTAAWVLGAFEATRRAR